MWFFNATFPEIAMRILSVLVIIFLILPLHEMAHGWMASKLGDNTAKYSGRLTLNPLAHVDPFGAVCILLFGFGWAKAVPVNPRNLNNPKRDMALVGLAGPVSNLIAALVGAILYNLIWLLGLPGEVMQWVVVFFGFYVSININLAVFNLLPIPPLDGSRILGAFLSDRALYKYYQYENYIMIGLFFLLFIGVLDVPLRFLSNLVSNGVWWLANLPFGF